MRDNIPVLALAIGAFAIGTSEFAPMGLLPVIAHGLGVSIPATGLLVSAYAIGVMAGAPVVTLLLGPLRRRAALLLLMAVFTIGNALSAVAPEYWTLLAARVVTSLMHGAFFGIGATVAADLVPAERRGSALATMFMGLTLANVGGVPLATTIGHAAGWRAAFAGAAGLGLFATLALRLGLPEGGAGVRPAIRRELAVLMRPAVQLAFGVTVLAAGAAFTLYTYVAPVLAHLAHASPGFVTFALLLIGVGFTIGNWIGGRLANWSMDGASAIATGAIAAVMMAAPLVMTGPWSAAIVLLAWGAAVFAMVAPVQMRVMAVAADAPGLASSVNIGAFNVGNALGAAVGGGVIALGLGDRAVMVAGGLLALGSFVLVAVGHRQRRAIACPA